jgi:putative hydrolase of the HAD superfamily
VTATRAVLLDVLGTLVRMRPPAPLLRDELARRGLPVEIDAAGAAFRAEIGYYLEHHLEGRDPAALAELRNRCAAVLRDALGIPGLPVADAREALLQSIRFEAYPDAASALGELRARGLRLVAASNWDCSLPEVLERAGLRELLDGVVASAEVGAAKPAAALFEAALAAAGCDAGEALHAGDSLENDVGGARGAGIRAVLVHRGGAGADPPRVPDGVAVVSALDGLAALT